MMSWFISVFLQMCRVPDHQPGCPILLARNQVTRHPLKKDCTCGRGDGERNDAPTWKWMDDIATWSAGDQHHWYQCGYLVCEANTFSMWHLSSTGHFLSFVDVMRHLRWTNDFAPHVGDMLEWATCFQSVQTVLRATVGLFYLQRVFGMMFELSTDRVDDVQWKGAQNGRISERAGQSSSSSSCRSHATTFLVLLTVADVLRMIIVQQLQVMSDDFPKKCFPLLRNWTPGLLHRSAFLRHGKLQD